MKSLLFYLQLIRSKTIPKIVLWLGLFFLLLIIAVSWFIDQKPNYSFPLKSADQPGLTWLDSAGAIRGIISANEQSIGKEAPAIQPATGKNQEELFYQLVIDNLESQSSEDKQNSENGQIAINQNYSSVDSSSSTTNSPTAVGGGNGSSSTGQSTPTPTSALKITWLQPADKSGFTQGEPITFRVEAQDTSNSKLLLYKYYIDDQPISDWTDKNSLEWLAKVEAPMKHLVKVEVRNNLGQIASKTQELFLYLKPIGFE